jgi:hypothetical protein
MNYFEVYISLSQLLMYFSKAQKVDKMGFTLHYFLV